VIVDRRNRAVSLRWRAGAARRHQRCARDPPRCRLTGALQREPVLRSEDDAHRGH